MKRIDLVGKKFGRLTVLKYVKNDECNQAMWECLCICGNISVVRGYSLRSGRAKSCGCLRNEASKKRATVHGLYYNKDGGQRRLYKIYHGMKKRCLNKKSKEYKDYGGRNISICDEWINNFENFYNWAIENGYHKKFSIERINNNGNYEPNNCTWIPRPNQNKNKRDTIRIEFDGKNLTLNEWSKKIGISHSALYLRIKKYKWSIEKALSTPNRKINRIY